MPLSNDELPDDLISTKQAAKLIHVDAASVCRWVMKGKLRGWRRVGRVMVSKADILAVTQPIDPRGVKRPPPPPQRQREMQKAWTESVLREAGIL